MSRPLRVRLQSWLLRLGLARPALPLRTGDHRIYHVHIRKTAGTSLNHAFLGLAGGDPSEIYRRLAIPPHRVGAGKFRFSAWDARVLRRGDFFYGFSHIPFWRLRFPERTFLFTCLRDPVARVVSHYRMLVGYRDRGIPHPGMTIEGPWLGSCFRDFLANVPREELLAHLSMFSPNLDLDEALANLARMSQVLFCEELASGVGRMGERLGIPLTIDHRRRSEPVDIPTDDIERLREMLAPEYRFIELARKRCQPLDASSA